MDIRDVFGRLGLDASSATALLVEAAYRTRLDGLESRIATAGTDAEAQELEGLLIGLEDDRAAVLAHLAEKSAPALAQPDGDEDRTLVFGGRGGGAGSAPAPEPPLARSATDDDDGEQSIVFSHRRPVPPVAEPDVPEGPSRVPPPPPPAPPSPAETLPMISAVVIPPASSAPAITEDKPAHDPSPTPPTRPGYGTDPADPASTALDDSAGALVASRYRLTRLVPGLVNGLEMWMARDSVTGAPVAIKSLPAVRAIDQAERKRFLAAGRKGLAVHHPSILGVLDVGENQGRAFVVQEAPSDGSFTLRERLSGWGADVPGRQGLALDVTKRVGGALAEAHRAGLFHLGLGFESVWIDETGSARVADFGLSPSVGVEGSARFAAPEQAAESYGSTVGAAADQYALAAMLKRLLGSGTGAPKGAAPPPSVARAMARALSPDPAARFMSVAEFMVALDLPPARRAGGATRALAMAAAAVALAAAGWQLWKLAEPRVATYRAKKAEAAYESMTYDPAVSGKRDLTVDVSGQGDMKSLQEAVRQGKPGAVITVRPGNYTGTLAPTVELTLVGDGAPGSVVITGPQGDAVLSAGPDGTGAVTLRNLKLVRRRLGLGAGETSAAVELSGRALTMESVEIEAAGGGGLRLRDSPTSLSAVTVTGSRDDGISAEGTGRVMLTACTVSGPGGRGISAAGEGCVLDATSCTVERAIRSGIAVSANASATLTTCGVKSGAEAGVLCAGGARLAMEGCRISGQQGGAEAAGVAVSGGSSLSLKDSDLLDNAAGGARIDAGSRLEAWNSTFGAADGTTGSGSNSADGLVVKGPAAKAAVTGCRFIGNRDHGMLVTDGAGADVADSDFTHNRVGLSLKKSATLAVRGCRFDGNREHAVEALDLTRGKLDSCDFRNTPVSAGKPGGRTAALFNIPKSATLDVTGSTGDAAEEQPSPRSPQRSQ